MLHNLKKKKKLFYLSPNRAGDTTLHKVDTGQKNEFLQDLDKEVRKVVE